MKIIPTYFNVELTLEDLSELLQLQTVYRALLERHPDWWTRRHLGPIPITLTRGEVRHPIWAQVVGHDTAEGTLTLWSSLAGENNYLLGRFAIPSGVTTGNFTDMLIRLSLDHARPGAPQTRAVAILLCRDVSWREGDPTEPLFQGIH